MFGKAHRSFALLGLIIVALMAPTVVLADFRPTPFGPLEPIPEDAAMEHFDSGAAARSRTKPDILNAVPEMQEHLAQLSAQAPKPAQQRVTFAPLPGGDGQPSPASSLERAPSTLTDGQPSTASPPLKGILRNRQPYPASSPERPLLPNQDTRLIPVRAQSPPIAPQDSPRTTLQDLLQAEQAGQNKGSWWSNWNWPWSRQPQQQPVVNTAPYSSPEQIGKIIEGPPAQPPRTWFGRFNPGARLRTAFGSWNHYKMTGKADDAYYLQQAARQGKPLFVVAPDKGTYEVTHLPQGGHQVKEWGGQTYNMLKNGFRNGALKSPGGSTWLGRLTDTASGFFGKATKYLRPVA